MRALIAPGHQSGDPIKSAQRIVQMKVEFTCRLNNLGEPINSTRRCRKQRLVIVAERQHLVHRIRQRQRDQTLDLRYHGLQAAH